MANPDDAAAEAAERKRAREWKALADACEDRAEKVAKVLEAALRSGNDSILHFVAQAAITELRTPVGRGRTE